MNAIRLWNHCTNGMGALQWDGLLPALALMGVPEADTELLLDLMAVIRSHDPSDPNGQPHVTRNPLD